jgi:hypothetical protein
MKKKLLLISSLLFLTSVYAQQTKVINLPNFDKKPWNFGYYLGINKNSYVVDYRPSNFTNAKVKVEPKIGFIIGVMVEKRLHDNLSLRFEPGLISNSKNLYFSNSNGSFLVEKDSLREVSATYMHLPLLFKFSANRLRNIKPYVVGGFSLDYNFSANDKNPDDNFSGEFRTKRWNTMYEVGIGVDFYTSYFKFSPSIRGLFNMGNELIDDNQGAASPWTAPIDRMTTRGIFLKLTFE